jgi:broad specificity phosphatase PhoE
MTDTLLFIRHAETDLAGRFCGHSDPPVNQRGLHQIEELIATIKAESIDAIHASDLSRSLTTAEAIGRVFGLSPIKAPELREIDFGEWEGLSWQEIESRDQVYARRWSEAYPDLPAPGGETFDTFRFRVLNKVGELCTMTSQKCAAVVTHAGVMRGVLRSFYGLTEQEAWERTKAYCGFFQLRPREIALSEAKLEDALITARHFASR